MITIIFYCHNVTNSQHYSLNPLLDERYMMVCQKPTETNKPEIIGMLALLVQCWFYTTNKINTVSKAVVSLLLAVGSKNNNLKIRG